MSPVRPDDDPTASDPTDPLDRFLHFGPSFDRAAAWVRSPDSATRASLQELVTVVAVRLEVERAVLLPALESRNGEVGYDAQSARANEQIERLLLTVDRRDVGSADLGELFAQLEDAVQAQAERLDPAVGRYCSLLTADKRAAFLVDLERASDLALTRPHPHLPRRGPAARVAHGLFARMDRVRSRRLVR